MDRNNVTPPELNQQQKPVKRMEKIRRSLSFRRKKKSDKLSKQLTMNGDSPVNNLPSSISAPINVNNNNNSSSSASANVSKSNSTTTQALVANHHTTIVQGTTMPPTTNSNSIQSDTAANNTNAAAPATTPISSVAKPPHWIEDEKKVRAGNCSFQVKYLGSSEVSDSRGMHLCEMAIEKLLAVFIILNFITITYLSHTIKENKRLNLKCLVNLFIKCSRAKNLNEKANHIKCCS